MPWRHFRSVQFGDKDVVVGLTKGDSLANAVAAMEVFSWRSDTAVNRDALIHPPKSLPGSLCKTKSMSRKTLVAKPSKNKTRQTIPKRKETLLGAKIIHRRRRAMIMRWR